LAYTGAGEVLHPDKLRTKTFKQPLLRWPVRPPSGTIWHVRRDSWTDGRRGEATLEVHGHRTNRGSCTGAGASVSHGWNSRMAGIQAILAAGAGWMPVGGNAS